MSQGLGPRQRALNDLGHAASRTSASRIMPATSQEGIVLVAPAGRSGLPPRVQDASFATTTRAHSLPACARDADVDAFIDV